jgi:TIR domain
VVVFKTQKTNGLLSSKIREKFMQSGQSRESTIKLLDQSYNLRTELSRRLVFTTDPFELQKTRFEIESVNSSIQRLEEQLRYLKMQSDSSLYLESLSSEQDKPLKIFIAHAGDYEKARELYYRLAGAGYETWLKDEDLLPGERIQSSISNQISTSDVVLICFSQKSAYSTSFQTELNTILNQIVELPEGAIFIIPVKFEECELPDSLKKIKPVNLFERAGYEILFKALNLRASALAK